MSLDTDSISEMSNQGLFSLMDNKKQAIERLQSKGGDSKSHEIDYCYLQRERDWRFRNRPKKHNAQRN